MAKVDSILWKKHYEKHISYVQTYTEKQYIRKYIINVLHVKSTLFRKIIKMHMYSILKKDTTCNTLNSQIFKASRFLKIILRFHSGILILYNMNA